MHLEETKSDVSLNELESQVSRLITRALSTYHMIEPHDRVLVAVSGGKDSAVLLYMLGQIQKKAPYPFSLQPVLLDQKQPGFQVRDFSLWVKETMGQELIVLEEDTYSIVKEKTKEGKTYCGLCSRLRRGILYTYAKNQGFQKIALGHHREDLNTTFLMNLFFGGSVSSMPPKLLSEDAQNVVIRPLSLCSESSIAALAQKLKVPVIPCNLCGSQENLQRKKMAKLIEDLEKTNPTVRSSLIGAQSNLKPNLMADSFFFDFKELKPRRDL